MHRPKHSDIQLILPPWSQKQGVRLSESCSALWWLWNDHEIHKTLYPKTCYNFISLSMSIGVQYFLHKRWLLPGTISFEVFFIHWFTELFLSNSNFLISLCLLLDALNYFICHLSLPELMLCSLNYHRSVMAVGICHRRSPLLFIFFRNGWIIFRLCSST